MKLLFNYLAHSMKESETVKSKTTPSKSNGNLSRAYKTNGNTKIIKGKPSTSGTDLKLSKFFGSFKVTRSPHPDGDSFDLPANKRAGNSQANGTPTKRINSNSARSTPSSKKSTPSKKPRISATQKSASLSSSASAKKRAIERVLKKKDQDTANNAKRKLELPGKKRGRKPRKIEDEPGLEEGKHAKINKGKLSPSQKSKRGRKRTGCGDEDSGKPRPRRRASQTYFFKYQLARNPLKAEEEDLKQALLASLQQCGQQESTSSKKQKQLLNDLLLQDQTSNASTTSKASKASKTSKLNARENRHQKQPRKQHPKRPPNSKHSKTSSLSIPQNLTPVTLTSVATSTPPSYDEEYLEKYRPDTEDFLTFICFRVTAPKLPAFREADNDSKSSIPLPIPQSDLINGCASSNNSSNITGSLNIKIEPNTIGNGVINSTSSQAPPMTTDNNYLNPRRSISPCKMSNSASSVAGNQPNSPLSNRRRPPTRQSPRLASSTHQQQKISDLVQESCLYRSQQFLNNFNTASNQNIIIDYEEDLKRASIALEDMAQEISKTNGFEATSSPSSVTTRQQNGKSLQSHNLLLSTADTIDTQQQAFNPNINSKYPPNTSSSLTTLPFKGNKHLVKGLMTREFAGTFADEEIIFESISNHKL